MRITTTATLGLALALTTIAPTALADDTPLSSLTAQWWQLVTSIPPSVNPASDATGADCMLGQHGALWFLTGTLAGGTPVRTCSIPEGEWLFFPVVNFVNINAPNVCGQNSSNISVATLRSQIAPSIDGASNLAVQLDGHTVKDLDRVKSVPFAITFPADNIFNASCGGAGTVPAGVYSPAVDDGVYALLKPLTVGSHTLHIHGEIPSQSVVVDVRYNLTIVRVLSESQPTGN